MSKVENQLNSAKQTNLMAVTLKQFYLVTPVIALRVAGKIK